MVTTTRDSALPAGLADYPGGAAFDEAIAAPGEPRGLYAELLNALVGADLASLARGAQAGVAGRGATFGADSPIGVDPVPRLLDGVEWAAVAAGLTQRVRALNAFLLDAYGDGEIFAAGRAPAHLLETAPGFEPRMRGLLDPDVPPATVAGLDLIRDPAGRLLVLEDNLRMPSGATYAAALRDVIGPLLSSSLEPQPTPPFAETLGAALGYAGEGAVALLSDGPQSGAWFEHRTLATALGIPVVLPGELETAGGRLHARIGRDRMQLDVLYRRTDEERLTTATGAPTALGELLLGPLEAGRLRCLNAFGAGVADDKLAHAYVGEMIQFYLGESPLLSSVPSIDLCTAEGIAEAEERLDELVVKPRDGFGGRGVTFAGAEVARREGLLEAMRAQPATFVAQTVVELSTHPTVCDGVLRPRRVDLRPFVISAPGSTEAMAGGLTRFAREAGELIVNSSRGGGCKDTWVVDR